MLSSTPLDCAVVCVPQAAQSGNWFGEIKKIGDRTTCEVQRPQIPKPTAGLDVQGGLVDELRFQESFGVF